MRIRQKGYRGRTVVIQPQFLVNKKKNTAKKHANWNYFDDPRFERIEKNIYLRSLNKYFSELSSTNWTGMFFLIINTNLFTNKKFINDILQCNDLLFRF